MVSVIVPIYNTSNFLSDCVNSIINQTYRDLEVILVNDGSTDKCLQICESYSSRDSRIIIINKQNEGVDRARFAGLSISKGEFVTFVDSDDWLCDNNIIKKMVDKAEETGSDYVEMGMQRVLDKNAWIKRPSVKPRFGLLTQPELFDKYYISFFGCNILSVTIWGKLYKKSVIEKANLVPSGIAMGEDLLFNMSLFPHLNSIYILEDIGYSYRFGGMTTRYNARLYPDLKFLYNKKKELIRNYSYNKANDYIRYEMVNVFKSDICQKIMYMIASKNEIISQIQKELGDPIWQDLKDISNRLYLDTPIPKAVLSGNADIIYSICNEEVRKGYPRWMMKRLASMLLRYI